MLTNEAFNALLKTLEEPPPHVIFIFATTEPQKIPATIHSRCQRYGFKRVALNEIIERLRKIAAAEGITISDQGLAMIARAAEGSMRDSQSLLDQAVSYSGMEIKDDDLQATLGSVAQEALLQFTSGLLARESAGLLAQVDALLEQGQDMRQFLSGVVEHLRNLLMVKITAAPEKIVELPASDIEAIKQQAASVESEHLLLLFDSLSKTLDDMRWSPHQRFTFEIGLIKACSSPSLQPLGEVLGKMKELEARFASGTGPASSAPALRVSERSAPYSSRPSPQSAPRPTGTSGSHEDTWTRIVAAVRSKKASLASFLDHSRILELSATDIVIRVKGDFQKEQVEKPESLVMIEQAAAEIVGRKVRVQVQLDQASAEPGVKRTPQKKTKAEEHNPAIDDVLRVFTQGEVIEQHEPEE